MWRMWWFCLPTAFLWRKWLPTQPWYRGEFVMARAHWHISASSQLETFLFWFLWGWLLNPEPHTRETCTLFLSHIPSPVSCFIKTSIWIREERSSLSSQLSKVIKDMELPATNSTETWRQLPHRSSKMSNSCDFIKAPISSLLWSSLVCQSSELKDGFPHLNGKIPQLFRKGLGPPCFILQPLVLYPQRFRKNF